jgi:hypothetical protein
MLSRHAIGTWCFLLAIGAAVDFAGLLDPGGEAHAGSLTGNVKCTIRVTPGPDFLRLEAIAQSGTPVSGQYDLSISKQSSTGSSQNMQSGDFSLTTDQEQILATTALDPSAQGHYSARLSLEWRQGRVTCGSP